MATYYGTYGQKVQYLASDPSDPQTGQVWYNSTSAVLKVQSVTTAGAWATANYVSVTGATSVVGTSGATFYITGVQLEIGTSATPFERRLYNQELANCQRYFYKVNADAAYGTNRFGSVFFPTTTIAAGIIQFPVTMRTFPTGSYSSLSDWTISASVGTLSVSAIAINTLPFNSELDFTVSGATAGQGGQIRANTNTASISFSAEL